MGNVAAVEDKAPALKAMEESIIASSACQMHCITTEKEFHALEQEWDELARIANLHVFQTFTWNRIWWKHFGGNCRLLLLVMRSNDKLLGIAPMFQDTVRVAGLSVYRILRLIGSYVFETANRPLLGSKAYSDYLDFIIHPGFELQFYTGFANFTFEQNDFHHIIFDELNEKSHIWNGLLPLLEKQGFRCRVSDTSRCPVIEKVQDWEGYLSDRSLKERASLRKALRRYSNGDCRIFQIAEANGHGGISENIDRLMDLHQQQWNSKGLTGSFAEPCMRGFFKEFFHTLHARGQAHVFCAYQANQIADGRELAMNAVIKYNDRMYLVHRALDLASDLLNKAPGRALLVHNIRMALEKGLVLELLRGDEIHKYSVATNISINKTLKVCCDGWYARVMGSLIFMYLKARRRVAIERCLFRIIIGRGPYILSWFTYLATIYKRVSNRFLDLKYSDHSKDLVI